MTGLVPVISDGGAPRRVAGKSPDMTMEAMGSRQ